MSSTASTSTSTSTTTYKKRHSDALSDAKPDILNATPLSSTHTHKKRRLEDHHLGPNSRSAELRATYVVSSQMSLQDSTRRSSNATRMSLHRASNELSDATERSNPSPVPKPVKPHPNSPSSAAMPIKRLISTQRLGPCVVVKKYAVLGPRTHVQKPATNEHTQSPSKRSYTTSRASASVARSDSSSAKRKVQAGPSQQLMARAQKGGPHAKATVLQQSHMRDQPKSPDGKGPTEMTRANPSQRPQARSKSTREQTPGMSLEEWKLTMAKIGLGDLKYPLTRREMPSFRKNKAGGT